ncbi:MAG: WYL domain-containing protein [Planctomycetes bacterium]|nr:WYL domain-containing protein [Planctomycetota bacterium]
MESPPDPDGPGADDRVEKTERLLNLVSCLLAARTPVPFSGIRGEVVGYDDDADAEAMEKRFDRDKAELRALGVPIEYVAMDRHGNSGYGIRKDRYFLPEISLDAEEALVLAVLHRMAVEGGAALGPNLLSALQKVSADSPPGDALQSSLAEQHAFGLRPGRGAVEEHEALEALTEAVLTRRRVRFRYYAIGPDRTLDRDVDPYGLGYHGGHWYLVGFDHLRRAERSFRVDRVRGRVKAGPAGAFEVPAGFRVQERIGRPPWEFEERRPVKGRIRFSPAIAWMVKENLRPGERFAEEADGSGVLEIEARDREALLRFAMKHGRLAEVAGPPDLRREARAAWQATLDMHRGAPRDPGAGGSAAAGRGAGRGRAP